MSALGIERMTCAQSILFQKAVVEDDNKNIVIQSSRVSGKTTGLAMCVAGFLEKHKGTADIKFATVDPEYIETKFSFLREYAETTGSNLQINHPSSLLRVGTTSDVCRGGGACGGGDITKKVLCIDISFLKKSGEIVDELARSFSDHQLIVTTMLPLETSTVKFDYCFFNPKEKLFQDCHVNELATTADSSSFFFSDSLDDYLTRMEPFCFTKGIICVKNTSQLRLIKNYLQKKLWAVQALDTSMSNEQVKEITDAFNNRGEIRWIIATVRAAALFKDNGNVQSVIFYDIPDDLDEDMFKIVCGKTKHFRQETGLAFFIFQSNRSFYTRLGIN